MNKPDIKKLKYPLWLQIVFYALTVVGPIILIAIEGFQSPHSGFRFTFGVISALLLTWTFLKKFIIVKVIKKYTDKKSTLEHEYEVEIGTAEKVKYLWFTNEIWLNMFEAIEVILLGSFICILAYGIQSGLYTVKAITLIIALFYLIAYVTKFMYIYVTRDEEYGTKDNTKENTEEHS